MSDRDKAKLSDNWRFAETSVPVEADTLEAYIVKYGEERALGYLEAIADVRAEADWMLLHWNPSNGGFARSASKTQVMLKDFTKHKEKLIKCAVEHPIIKSDKALVKKLKQK
ncbi:hypothetical protein SAMN04488511_11412 [Pedobacter suwonensis]|uniref:Uncharacterized protein n=1 Tax=Pedobacter suwonensis TaxID=332999 RepID=A0A1I0TSP4_9SPHI|nr:hypothetical protein [Pedobacter suwonensis]SFA54789.1 hypothetical protein SAMN04488511_11412 [Pedobacter suwonensis]